MRRLPVYVPKPFIESRVKELHRIIQENSLGTLVVQGAGGLDAHHLPFLLGLDGDTCRLIAHVARGNPVWREVRDGDAVLVIFHGAQGYVSPNWYPGKQETHRRVPTWNYEAVQYVYGVGLRGRSHGGGVVRCRRRMRGCWQEGDGMAILCVHAWTPATANRQNPWAKRRACHRR